MPDPPPTPRFRLWAASAMLWLVVAAAAVCIALLGLLSVRRLTSPVEIENAYVALVVAQAFFLLMLWPLFEHRAPHAPLGRSLAEMLTRLAGLMLLALPLVAVTSRTTQLSTGQILRSQALLMTLGAAVGVALRLPGARIWYYPAAYLLSAGVPFIAWVLYETGGPTPLAWASALCPVWACGAAAAGTRALLPTAVFAGLALLGLAWLALARTRRSPDQA